MENTYSISIKKIRKIMLRILFKKGWMIALVCSMAFFLAMYIYIRVLGFIANDDPSSVSSKYFSLFIISLVGALTAIYVYAFKKTPRKGKTIITFEYKFNDNNVIVKNLTNNKSYVLNKQHIKEHYIIHDVLVIEETFYYFFPNDEEIKKALCLKQF